jgi:hypothetical protein
MPTLTRRGLLVLGGTGAAGVALAGCSSATEPRDEASTDELTAGEVDAENALAGAYDTAAGAASEAQQRAALQSFAAAAKKRATEIDSSASESAAPPSDGGPDLPEALGACISLANEAIAAHLEAARLLDEVEGRALATSSLAACAAELAVVNGFSHQPQAPNAFVTGGSRPALESFDRPDSSEQSTTTTSSTSTTSSTTQ